MALESNAGPWSERCERRRVVKLWLRDRGATQLVGSQLMFVDVSGVGDLEAESLKFDHGLPRYLCVVLFHGISSDRVK